MASVNLKQNQSQARAFLARDEQLARSHQRNVARTFRQELEDVLPLVGHGDPAIAVEASRWIDTLGNIWVDVGERVYPDAVDRLTGLGKQNTTRLIALVERIVRDGRPATQVASFVEEAAEGIAATSRRRIHTILREAGPPANVRNVTRALRRLYQTEFVNDRSARIALDNVLRASMTFEHTAAVQTAESTGRTYVKSWVTQGDANVRETHQRAQAVNQDVPLEGMFQVGNTLLRYPRDPRGPLGETLNCRCWMETRRL